MDGMVGGTWMEWGVNKDREDLCLGVFRQKNKRTKEEMVLAVSGNFTRTERTEWTDDALVIFRQKNIRTED